MNIIIKNNTLFSFSVTCEENTYQLPYKRTVALSSKLQETALYFEILEKDSVSIDISDVILGLFFGDSTLTKVYCDYEIKLKRLNAENITIILEENRWCPRTQVSFFSACAISENCETIDNLFAAKNLEKTRKKHKRIHSFVTSLLPLGIILFACIFIFSPPAASILFFFFWALIFAFPSFKEIKRFKELSDPNLINEKLTAHAKYRREHGEDFFDWDSRTDKFFKKILDKMFKPNEDK